MATFPLRLLSMNGPVFEGDVAFVTVPTEKGPLTIEPGYTNFIGALSPAGVLIIGTGRGKEYYAVFGGAVDVKRNQGVSIYSEDVNYGYEIDMARAMASRDRNLDRIAKHEDGVDIQRARIKLAKALVRINVKTLSEGGNGAF
ncbi:MAG: F0F1 ATP synthase subunit epsilon [Bacilli bacterium]|nr:F0F1 ATP synthase subunit epsilon [Bacilli bacterium]